MTIDMQAPPDGVNNVIADDIHELLEEEHDYNVTDFLITVEGTTLKIDLQWEGL